MPNYNVQIDGTRTSGESTDTGNDILDWAADNCYDNLMLLEPIVAANDADINFDDGINTMDDDISGLFWEGDIVLVSRNGDKDACSLITSEPERMFVGNTPNAGTLTVNNMFLGRDHDVAEGVFSANYSLIQVGGGQTNVDFNGCGFGGFDCDVIANLGTGLLLANESTAGCLITYTDCDIGNMALSGAGWKALIMNKVGTVTLDTCHFHDMIKTHDVDDPCGWVWNVQASNGIMVVNDCIVTDVTTTNIATNPLHGNRPFFYNATFAGLLAIANLTASGMRWSGGASGVFLASSTSPYTVDRITANDCTSIPTGAVNAVGGVFLSSGSSASGPARHIKVTNSRANFGLAFYGTNGGEGVLEDIVCTDSMVKQGAVYSGGDGDIQVTGYLAAILTSIDDGTVDESDGLAFYSHIHPVNGSRNKTTILRNITIAGCVNSIAGSDGIVGMVLKNRHDTYTHTVTMENIICRNDAGAGKEIEYIELVAGKLTVNLDTVNTSGDINDINANINISNYIEDTGTTFDNTVDYSLHSSSDLNGIGVKGWTGRNPTSAGGEPISNIDIDCGGVMSTNGAFHPVNLSRF